MDKRGTYDRVNSAPMDAGRSCRPALRLADRIMLKRSLARTHDGLWIGTWRGREGHLAKIEEALDLIERVCPIRYAQVKRELDRIWVQLIVDGLAVYRSDIAACVIDERFMDGEATTSAHVASTILHEATHARLERYGFAYEESDRSRIEMICFRRELAFASKLPDSEDLQQWTREAITWYSENPTHFSDEQRATRYASDVEQAMRHLDFPSWMVRSMVTFVLFGRAVRRFFHWPKRRNRSE